MKLARSKAGHDKDDVYVIISEDEIYVYLANGKNKTLSLPKKKKKKHIQPIVHLPKAVEEMLAKDAPMSDEGIRTILSVYNKNSQ